MKKAISLLMSVMMTLSVFSAAITANAASGTWIGNDYYQYEIVDGTARITAHSQHNGYDSTVYIPDSINGYTVTVIGKSSFIKHFNGITEYVIPSTVTEIGDAAFSQGSASEVQTLVIPSSVVTIGKNAFSSMKKLTSLTICEGVVTIGDYAFYGDAAIENIVIPKTVRSIGKSAFQDCVSLNHINLKNGVKTIGDYAFSGGIYPSIVIPKSVTSIGASAFSTRKTLKKATVMNSKCKIADNTSVFYGANTDKKVKLYGFDNSTLYKYAKKYNYLYQFVSLTTPTATKITKLTAKSKAFAVKWSKAANCMGYQVQYSTSKNMKGAKTVTVKGSSTLTRTVKNLKKKKIYYVRVRAYNKYGGKTYFTKWSAVKKVKTK
ncbi:MAG: hypothetical protein E7571_04810 [Ruminococcaceae bacterium]|nr:hypothetical protein [Oscillospiraceae bacterium]